MEMHLISRQDQHSPVDNQHFFIAEGESIRTDTRTSTASRISAQWPTPLASVSDQFGPTSKPTSACNTGPSTMTDGRPIVSLDRHF